MRLVIRQLRRIKTLVVELCYYFVMACSQLWMLVAGGAAGDAGRAMVETAAKKLMMYANLVLVRVANILEEIMRVVFRLIFGQGMPQKIVEFIQLLCEWKEMIKNAIIGTSRNSGVLCSAFNWLSDVFESLGDGVTTVSKFIGSSLSGLSRVLYGISNEFANIITRSDEDADSCNFAYEEEEYAPKVRPAFITSHSTYTYH